MAALCAEEGRRRLVQRRVESAIALERFVMGGGPTLRGRTATRRRELVAEVEGHLRAMLRDVLCGYLDSDLKGVADDILLETNPEPFMEIEARDLRVRAAAPEPPPEPPPRPSRSRSPSPTTATRTRPRWRRSPCERQLEGVTQSADWGFDDPEDYSAPV